MSNIQQELEFEEVEKDILIKYAWTQSREKNVDEVDFFSHFLFGQELKTKEERFGQFLEPFDVVVNDYILKHYEPLKLTKEIIYSSKELTDLFKKKKLLARFDEFLECFYGKFV
jgi:hypothetical protein